MLEKKNNRKTVIRLFTLVLLICFILPASVYGDVLPESIKLDGLFDDWAGMPSIEDPVGDEERQSDFTSVAWFPDMERGRLYLYAERLYGFSDREKPVDWDFSISFDNSIEMRTAQIHYHPESQQVDVTLFDSNGGFLWQGKGKWGEDKYTGKRVEFYIPLSYIAGDIETGYMVNMSLLSGIDSAPDNGSVTISTASTFPWLIAVLMLAWIALIVFLSKRRMHFFKFLAGSIGLFIFVMILGSGVGEKFLENAVTRGLALVANITGSFSVLVTNSMVTVHHGMQAVSFIIDYECSGFIELMVYISILVFYPLFNWKSKVLYSVLGSLFIYIANLSRMLLISYSIKIFGTNVFFLSHTVFARILFFGLMVWLYYYVFTRQHIKNQKVGGLTYDG